MRMLTDAALGLVAWALCLTAAPPASYGASADGAWIDTCQYPDEAAARAAWRPMRGSEEVSMTEVEGRRALRLPCSFTGAKVERASWDHQVRLDLSSCRGIQFDLFCRDASPVSYFSFYLQSGEGWYHGTFYPESSNAWNTVTLEKSVFGIEGRPAGWSRVNTLRVSAWRGKEASTEFFISSLRQTGTLGNGALVAIVRAESASGRDPREARAVEQFTQTVAQHLDALGAGSAVISDLELTAERLKPARVVILPHNPGMPDRAVDELLQYWRSGGKLLAFYTLPEKLRAAFRVQAMPHVQAARPGYFSSIQLREQALPGAPRLVGQRSWNIYSAEPAPDGGRVLAEWLDDQGKPTGQAAIIGATNWLFMTHVLLNDEPEKKRRLLLAMAGYLAPEVWRQVAQAGLDRVGVLGGYKDFEQAAAGIAEKARDNQQAMAALSAARRLRQDAAQSLSQRRVAEALDRATEASRRVKEAWCLAQASLPGEFRAFWCHSAFGVEGMDWDEAVRRLADNGFNAVLPNMLWGGVAFYESAVLPVAPQVKDQGDQIAKCLAACRKYGVQVHVWKVNWNTGGAAPKDFLERLRREGRLQADSRGREEPWLCPSHPDNQRLEIESMVEVARKYDVDGLHFDYIRYPDGDHCFCAGCRERFQATGVTAANWPGDVLPDGTLHSRWLDWRRENISGVVKAVSEQARALRPRLKISAAVFRNWPTDRDTIGQDWRLWCERGWLDFVCPMDYMTSHRQFENAVFQQRQWAGRVPCYPGIGESATTPRLGIEGVIEQIHITRRQQTGGFAIFNYGVAECKDLLPLLGLGITANRTSAPNPNSP